MTKAEEERIQQKDAETGNKTVKKVLHTYLLLDRNETEWTGSRNRSLADLIYVWEEEQDE